MIEILFVAHLTDHCFKKMDRHLESLEVWGSVGPQTEKT